MINRMTTLCYIEKDDSYLMMHRIKKQNDINKDKWIGIGGHFLPGESPEECLLREVYEETGLKLTSYRFRGVVTFVPDNGEYEYMMLYTADGYEGELIASSDCNEGALEWVKKSRIKELDIWEGDKIFFDLLDNHREFFSLKLLYEGNALVGATLDGVDINRKIFDHAKNIDTSVLRSCTQIKASGETVRKDMEIACENFLAVTVNGMQAFRLSCTPDCLSELVLGRLYTEGLIESINEVRMLVICDKGSKAEVVLNKEVEFSAYDGAEPTCCTGNRQFLKRAGTDEHAMLTNVEIDRNAVFALADHFQKDGELHKNTSGTHSCYIRFANGDILSFEDISRHNAVDKAVGAMLLKGENPGQCMLYTTGRIAADMVLKTSAAHIPVLISKAVPTDEALRLAEEKGLTLICRAWPDSYTVYD